VLESCLQIIYDLKEDLTSKEHPLNDEIRYFGEITKGKSSLCEKFYFLSGDVKITII
jgi:hypothetical protein